MANVEKIDSKSNFSLYSVKDASLPENTYILSSAISREILYNPHIAGKKLQDLLGNMSIIFMEALGSTALKGSKLGNCCELIFLSGGLYYNLNSGFKKAHGEALPQAFLGIKRARVEGSEGKFSAYASYENFESLPDNATVIIGDTIATGATMQKGLQYLFDALEEKGYALDRLIILTLAGSTSGAKKIREAEKSMKQQFPKAKLYFIACEQLFHLMPDGTDLRFLKETAISPEETKKNTLDIYGEYLGSEMKCAVFDWGTRCKNPKKHYIEFLEFCDEMLAKKLDEKSRTVLERMKKETEESIRVFEKELSI